MFRYCISLSAISPAFLQWLWGCGVGIMGGSKELVGRRARLNEYTCCWQFCDFLRGQEDVDFTWFENPLAVFARTLFHKSDLLHNLERLKLVAWHHM